MVLQTLVQVSLYYSIATSNINSDLVLLEILENKQSM